MLFGALLSIIGFAGAFAWTTKYSPANSELRSQREQDRASQSQNDKPDFYVNLKEDRAYPDTLTVPVGKTVQFNTMDGKKHKISLGEGGDEHGHSGTFSSGDFGKDEGWKSTFNDVGTYSFHDHYNPNINVLIVAYRPATQ